LLKTLNDFNENRISISHSLDEHQIQREILCTRTGSEAYRETARHLIQWKEYLFSTTKLNFLIKSPFEQTTTTFSKPRNSNKKHQRRREKDTSEKKTNKQAIKFSYSTDK
jgi:hypothetical protein